MVNNGNRSVMMASHLMDDVERVCDHMVLLHKGKLAAQGKIEDLKDIDREIETDKLYRTCLVNYQKYKEDLDNKIEKFTLKDLDKILEDLKSLFEKKGFMVDWSSLKKQDFSQTLNTLSMASPFSLEEKQALLETKDLNTRKLRLEEILKTYTLDEFSNKTIQ